MRLYGIAGTGGFAREVMPVAAAMLAQSSGNHDFELVFVTDGSDSSSINGHRVLTERDFFTGSGERFFNIAIANGALREKVAAKFIAGGALPFAIRAPNSIFLGESLIGEGCVFCPFTTVTANAKIGKFFHANLYSYIAHDCVIGDFVTFAPNVLCNGGVVIEDHAYIGAGAIIRQRTAESQIVIGSGAIVGMGAIVTKSVQPFSTVVGNPAAPLERKD